MTQKITIANSDALVALVKDALGVDDLAKLHETGPTYGLMTRETDQDTTYHKAFYELTNSPEWQEAYRYTVLDVSRSFGEEVLYQRVPTFRVALPDNLAVGAWHRDRDYGHSRHEVNVWVPLTDASGTQAVHCEAYEGADELLPLPCEVGSAIIFDGANLKHGNVVNKSGTTRVSFDFRLLPKRLYKETDAASINTHLPFRLPLAEGELTYWAEL